MADKCRVKYPKYEIVMIYSLKTVIIMCIPSFLVTSPLVFQPKQEGPTVSFNAATTLHNFCVWQQTQNVQDDSHPSHHDTALLITRFNLSSSSLWKQNQMSQGNVPLRQPLTSLYILCVLFFFREDICRAKDKCDTLGKLLQKYLYLTSLSINVTINCAVMSSWQAVSS